MDFLTYVLLTLPIAIFIAGLVMMYAYGYKHGKRDTIRNMTETLEMGKLPNYESGKHVR